MRKIILITGGQRSGKSLYAETIARKIDEKPIYLATSRIWDEEHRQRILRHQARRSKHWENREEEKAIDRQNVGGRTVLVDCLTLWSTNFFYDNNADTERSLQEMKEIFDRFVSQDATFIFVTNEIGNGGISPDTNQRKFTDLQGWINQYVASKADEVYLMVCGLPMKVK